MTDEQEDKHTDKYKIKIFRLLTSFSWYSKQNTDNP